MTKTNLFASLAARVDEGFKVRLINPATGKTIKDKDGKEAFIEVLSGDSAAAEAFDRERQKKANDAAAMSLLSGTQEDDEVPETVAKVAALTKSWHLVDLSGEVIDVPCTRENALMLYNGRETKWIYRQVMPQAGTIANFMRPSPKG